MHFYSKTFYEADTLKEEAKKYLKVLPKEVNVLVSMGSSGCSIASAMLVLSNRRLEHCHIRKDGEKAHTPDYTGYKPNRGDVIAIVDDFIATGDTINNIIDKLRSKSFKVKQNQIKIIIVDDSSERDFNGISKRIKIKTTFVLKHLDWK